MYTLVYKIIKSTKVGVAPFAQCAGPLCPSYWAKGATLRANLFLQLKYGILETLSESVIFIYIACTLHRTVIGFKIVRKLSLNTFKTLSDPLCPPFPYYTS